MIWLLPKKVKKKKKKIYTQENDDFTKEEANELLKNNNFATQEWKKYTYLLFHLKQKQDLNLLIMKTFNINFNWLSEYKINWKSPDTNSSKY